MDFVLNVILCIGCFVDLLTELARFGVERLSGQTYLRCALLPDRLARLESAEIG